MDNLKVEEWLSQHREVGLKEYDFSRGFTLHWTDSNQKGFDWTVQEELDSDLSLSMGGSFWVGYITADNLPKVLSLLGFFLSGDSPKTLGAIRDLQLLEA